LNNYTEYWEKGRLSKHYFVFDAKNTKQTVAAIKTIATEKKVKAENLEAVPVWIKGDYLYLEKVDKAKKMLAVVRRSAKK
jgi:hypothetical protein